MACHTAGGAALGTCGTAGEGGGGGGGQQDGEGRWREHTYIDEALSECALTILAVLASLVMEMMGQRGRNFASRKAVLDAETGWE